MCLLLFFSQSTPLHLSAIKGHLEVTRLLVESKADVTAENGCFSPPSFHHLSLTICLAALAEMHSKWPSDATNSTLLNTCSPSTLLNEAPPALPLSKQKHFLSPLLL
jgi:ankyrin repeat protein